MKALGIVEFKRGEFVLDGTLPAPPKGYEWRGIVTQYQQNLDYRGQFEVDARVRFVLERKSKGGRKA